MIRTLDRYVIRSFLYATALWFLVFMLLRITTHLFINMDEFAEQDLPFLELLGVVLDYYAYQSMLYFTELGGVIIVAAAAFTLAMMNRTNELVAILASGQSLRRVILPIVLCSVVMSGLILADREWLIPRYKSRLVLDPDNPGGANKLGVRGITDGRNAAWFSPTYDPVEQVLHSPVVLVRDANLSQLAIIYGEQGRPAPDRGAWRFTDAVLNGSRHGEPAWEVLPSTRQIYTRVGPKAIFRKALADAGGRAPLVNGRTEIRDVNFTDEQYNLRITGDSLPIAVPEPGEIRSVTAAGPLRNARFRFVTDDGRVLGIFRAETAWWQIDPDRQLGYWRLDGGVLEFPTDITVDDVVLRQTHQWMSFMSTGEIDRLLELGRIPDPNAARLTKYIRYTEPLNNLILLLLGLPFILSRERNIKASATMALLIVMAFYAFVYLCRQMDLPAPLAAWLPILLFGPVAAVMVDSIKT